MRKQLDTSKEAAPLYIQIKQDLKQKIEDGVWKPGEKIPNEMELCKVYNVSRITVREAINELVWEEYLVRKRAKGTYVLNPNEKFEGNNMYYTYVRSFTNEMQELGKEAKTIQVEVSLIEADDKLAKKLNASVGDAVIEMKRVRGVGGLAVVYFKTYLKNNVNLSTDSKDYYGSLYEMLKQKGITITKIKESLEAVRPTQEVQKVLHIAEDVPVLKRVRSAYSSQEIDFVEYTEGYYVGDQYKYLVDLNSTS